MKKTFYFIAMLAVALAFSACSNDSTEGDDPSTELAMARQAIKSKLFDVTEPNTEAKDHIVMEHEQIKYDWEAPFNVVEKLPESKTPEAVYSNYYYYAPGTPFKVVMLYSNGAYYHECGIYWYDENQEKQEYVFWDEYKEKQYVKDGDNTDATWLNPNHIGDSKNGAKLISRLKDETGAYLINLPANTKFGFFQVSHYGDDHGIVCAKDINERTCTKCNGTGKSNSKECGTCKGVGTIGDINAEHPFKFYSEKSLNWNDVCQTVTFNTDENWTVVGFEDISRTSKKVHWDCDNDFNDCVFAVNPHLEIVPIPTPDDPIITPPTEDANKGLVETNCSVTETPEGNQHIRLSIHVRANTDLTVTLPYQADKELRDDFAIVAKHDIEATYSREIKIGENIVKLIYGLTDDGYITITTDGITPEIINYCREVYKDGLTFECNLDVPTGVQISGEPTITFTKSENVYVYITSCANENDECEDLEVNWNDITDPIIENPKYGSDEEGAINYYHRYYSTETDKQELINYLKEKWPIYDDFNSFTTSEE